MKSTISARATIDTSCDERLDVEKSFPSLVSYFVFHVADSLLVHKITLIDMCYAFFQKSLEQYDLPARHIFICTLLQKDDTNRNH